MPNNKNSQVLYRKYRPQNFAEVIGQDHVKTILKNALLAERISHAYLFTGPRGVGKTTVARILAKAVNCQKPKKGEPDNKCLNCEAIKAGRFLDLVEIDAASYTGVDNIREIIEHVKFTPSQGQFKVFIIDEVHMLSKAAFNALLKTLEEPPEHAIFILATTEAHKVPATIISRTQRFDFRAASQADVLELFKLVLAEQKVKVSAEAERLIAQAGSGSFRDALSVLDQLMSVTDGEITLDLVESVLGLTRVEVHQKLLDRLIKSDQKEAAKLIRQLAFEGKDLVEFSRGLLEYLRLILLYKMGVEDIESTGLTSEEGERLQAQAEALSGAKLLRVVKSIMEAYRESKLAPVSELPLLTSVLQLTAASAPQTHSSAIKTEIPKVESSETDKDEPKAREPIEAASKASSGSFSLGLVVDRWAEVLNQVKEYNHSLISSLRLGRLVRVEESDLWVAFPYNFHKETIDARKNRIVIEQVLEDVFGHKLRLQTVLERDLKEEPAASGEGDLLKEAIKVLGGD